MNNSQDNKNDKEKDSTLKFLGLLGVAIGGGLTLGIAGPTVIENIQDSTSPYAKLGAGIPLERKGLHMREGEHNVIITDGFYDALDKSYEIRRDLTIESIKEAYKVLNQYNSGLKFNLVTTNDELSKNYDIPKFVDGGAVDDIYIYGTNEKIGNGNVVGQAHWDYDKKTYETKDLKIIFKLNSLYSIWKSYGSLEKTFTPRNWQVYSCVLHETMHEMGLAHITNRESVLNPKLTIPDLNEEDIKLLDKYNMQFYNKPSMFNKNEIVNNLKNPDNDYYIGMSM